MDNGLLHCFVFSTLFFLGSNLGPLGLYDFGVIYDEFCSSVAFLNLFGMALCVFLTTKGLTFPSTQDSGSSGSIVKDFLWGTELCVYPAPLPLQAFCCLSACSLLLLRATRQGGQWRGPVAVGGLLNA